MKVVFLDIDGVLNSRENDKKRALLSNLTKLESWKWDFDPILVSRLNRLLDETGAVVVISSSWRIGSSVPKIWEMMQSQGFTGKIIGTTPCFYLGGTYEGTLEHPHRGDEIEHWLRWTTPDVSAYVILDDYPEEEFEPLVSHLVRTDKNVGLQESDVDRAIATLNGT